jgi:phosphoglucosamine mutase
VRRRYFGTDGVRGRVGDDPMTVDFALRLASAAARVLAPAGGRVLIGKDTRVSGYMFEAALEAGFAAAGVDVLLVGPLPTPGIAYLTRWFEADFGIVISASHNAYQDNGIKFFDGDGAKLSDDVEAQIEDQLARPVLTRDSAALGKAKRVDSARLDYQEFCKASVPSGIDLNGLKIVIDCAHGAAYKTGPRVLAELGAEIVPIGCSPNGRNINDGCGSMQPELLQLTVKGVRADLGVALDGDGDRVVMVDERGELVDGDQVLYVIAAARHAERSLRGPVVGTVMSNLGLELALAEKGIAFERARVGDRHVLEMLRLHGGAIGGETSGHVICLDKTTTGDGLISALQVIAVVKQSGLRLSQLVAGMTKYPQRLLNVRTDRKIDLDRPGPLRAALEKAEAELGGQGRVVVRASGTEPVVRVMVEGLDEGQVERVADAIAAAVRHAAN